MLGHVRGFVRELAYPVRVAWRWRRTTLALIFLFVLVVPLAGGYWFACAQWEAAQTDLAEDRPAEALARLDVCLWVWPNDPEVRLRAARAARLGGNVQAAEAHLNRCLKLHHGRTEAVQLEFLLLRAQTGEVDEVANTLTDCVEKGHAESPLILATLARAYLQRGRYHRARAYLHKWVEICPNEAKPYQWRGWVQERLNQHKAASADYEKAVQLDPRLILVRLRIAEMLLEDKLPKDAVPHMEALYRQAPNNPQIQARLGMCRYYQNRTKDARRLMEAAAVHLPKDPALLVHLAKLDIDEGRGPEAERRLRQVLKNDRADTEALQNLASALELQDRTAEADAVRKEFDHYKELLERTHKLLREKVDAPGARADDYAEVGDLLLRIGRERLGEYWLEQALERDPWHQGARKTLTDHYEKKGDRKQVEAHRRFLKPKT
jgi:tetratricopeptide (TPR) repeat protein